MTREYKVLQALVTTSLPIPRPFHGDFTMDNVLIENNKVSGLIDWANGGYGDPRYDLALAMRAKDELFVSPRDNRAFVAGYGSDCLSLTDYRYFNALYEFF